MVRKKYLIYLLIFTLLLQIGCGSITQIPYPVDESKSENEIRQLNYFGEKLSASIGFIDSTEVEANWLILKANKLYLLTNRLDEPPYYEVNKIKSIKFYDLWCGILFGTLDGLFLAGVFRMAGPNYVMPTIGFFLGLGYGLYALGDREFNFVQKY